ncbi:MAG: aspartate aminotransferase family protein [Chitinivibrionales bacterium]|nr:aspartate aminotransferase family protein [Chitinivibrionales bacterium]
MNSTKFDQYFVNTFVRSAVPFTHGKGVYLFDSTGKKYLDFGSGLAVNALGYSHPSINKILVEQGKKLLHVSNWYYTLPQIELAQLLIKNSFADKIFLCNSGTEAIEAAIKFSRKWGTAASPRKYHILSFTDGFHGRTYGALSATAQKKFHDGFGPMLPGFHYAPFNDIKAAKALLAQHDYAAIIVEPLQAEGGVNCATKEFLSFLRQWTKENKCALIFDEIQCGLCRTGTVWNYEQYGIVPDMLASAKPLGGGLPLGAVLCKEEFVAGIKPGDHGTTFGGNPLACALGCATLKIITQKVFLAHVNSMGEHLKTMLRSLGSHYPAIKEVRGKGLLVGVEIEGNIVDLVHACETKGLLLMKAGRNTVRFMPPLIVEKKHIDSAVKIFGSVITKL